MTQKNHQEASSTRADIFRRILTLNNNTKASSLLLDQDNDTLLEILDMAVLPNATDLNNLKVSTAVSHVVFKTSREKEKFDKGIKDINTVFGALTKIEKAILQFGIYYGFTNNDPDYQIKRFSLKEFNPFTYNKKNSYRRITRFSFREAFPFFKLFLDKSEKNQKLPRIK